MMQTIRRRGLLLIAGRLSSSQPHARGRHGTAPSFGERSAPPCTYSRERTTVACPTHKAPETLVKRPRFRYKSTVERRFTVEDAKAGERPCLGGPTSTDVLGLAPSEMALVMAQISAGSQGSISMM
jgi:hypothetical protein